VVQKSEPSHCNPLTNFVVSASNPAFSALNNVLFNKTQTTLVQYANGLPNNNYNIPNSVNSIGGYAFYNCTNFTSVTIPNGVSTIGTFAFEQCSSLTNVVIPNSVNSIGDYAFASCASLQTLSLGSGITTIGTGVFSGYNNLNNVIIPNSVTTIGNQSFAFCGMMNNVTIPNSVNTIGPYAFDYCYNLTNATIGSGVTNIQSGAFYNCYNLTNVYFLGNEPSPTNDYSVFQGAYWAVARYLPGATGWGTNFDYISAILLPVPPTIVTPPIGSFIGLGSNYTFTVTASGPPPLAYQWLYYGTNVAGANTNSLTVFNLSTTNAGQYSVIITNAYGSVTSSVVTLTALTQAGQQLVQNGGFETGDFTGWSASGNTGNETISTKSDYAHSGSYGAQLGPVGALGYLTQSLSTTPGQAYVLSLWLDSPDGTTPNEFSVSWNGMNIFDKVNLGRTGWTNLIFKVTASSSSTLLSIGLRNDPSYFGLDDVSVAPYSPFPPLIISPAVGTGKVTASFNSVPSYPPVSYQVQVTTNLAAPNWVNVGAVNTGTNSMLGFTNTIGSGQNYYRVQLIQ
jgi:hypothetical protein